MLRLISPITPVLRRRAVAKSSKQHTKNRLSSRSFASASPTSSWQDTGDSNGTNTNSTATNSLNKLFNPTDDHAALREMVRSFTEREVEPQALEYNRSETFNSSLFRKFGSQNGGLGILGLTAPEVFGGTGLPDATAVSIVHEELSYSDPALCLSYLAHSILLVNNLAVNASEEQLARFMPGICDGSKIGAPWNMLPSAREAPDEHAARERGLADQRAVETLEHRARARLRALDLGRGKQGRLRRRHRLGSSCPKKSRTASR